MLQVLTSDTTLPRAALLCWLRARWRIENTFEYAAEHNGIDALADSQMHIAPDPRKVLNPARAAGRKRRMPVDDDDKDAHKDALGACAG